VLRTNQYYALLPLLASDAALTVMREGKMG
jgi:hypothetical protein